MKDVSLYRAINKFLSAVLIAVSMISIIGSAVMAESAYTLTAGVSLDKVPKTFFGSWRVSASMIKSTDYGSFKPKSTDLWNLKRTGDTVTLSNPFTGASSSVSVNTAEGNLVAFTRITDFDNKKLIDVVTLRLDGESFTGINDIILETYSVLDGHMLKRESAKYKITGEKLSGDSITNIK